MIRPLGGERQSVFQRDYMAVQGLRTLAADKLAVELAEVYPSLAAKLADLAARVAARHASR